MFTLEKNNFIDSNSCTYKDEYNNTAFMKREQGKIVAKIRFSDERIKASAMNIPFPVNSRTEGDTLHLEYPDEKLLTKSNIQDGINNFTQLINYWINMLYDVSLLEASPELFRKANPGNISDEQIAEYKFSRLLPYEELKPVLKNM